MWKQQIRNLFLSNANLYKWITKNDCVGMRVILILVSIEFLWYLAGWKCHNHCWRLGWIAFEIRSVVWFRNTLYCLVRPALISFSRVMDFNNFRIGFFYFINLFCSALKFYRKLTNIFTYLVTKKKVIYAMGLTMKSIKKCWKWMKCMNSYLKFIKWSYYLY